MTYGMGQAGQPFPLPTPRCLSMASIVSIDAVIIVFVYL